VSEEAGTHGFRPPTVFTTRVIPSIRSRGHVRTTRQGSVALPEVQKRFREDKLRETGRPTDVSDVTLLPFGGRRGCGGYADWPPTGDPE